MDGETGGTDQGRPVEDLPLKPVGERTSGRANPPLQAFTLGDAIRRKLKRVEERIGSDSIDAQTREWLDEIYASLDQLES